MLVERSVLIEQVGGGTALCIIGLLQAPRCMYTASCRTMARSAAPPGAIGDRPPRCSHRWVPARKYRNLEWKPEGSDRRVPNEREPQRVGAATPAKPDGSDFARILVQGKYLRKNRPFAMEICCGHAGLTAALWDAGLEAVGVD